MTCTSKPCCIKCHNNNKDQTFQLALQCFKSLVFLRLIIASVIIESCGMTLNMSVLYYISYAYIYISLFYNKICIGTEVGSSCNLYRGSSKSCLIYKISGLLFGCLSLIHNQESLKPIRSCVVSTFYNTIFRALVILTKVTLLSYNCLLVARGWS